MKTLSTRIRGQTSLPLLSFRAVTGTKDGEAPGVAGCQRAGTYFRFSDIDHRNIPEYAGLFS